MDDEDDPGNLLCADHGEKRPLSAQAGKPEQERPRPDIVHSTSWRYARPGKVMLTYVAYSDELEFEKVKAKSLPLKKLRAITKKSRKPRYRAELEKKIVSHALRHIAFLIQTGKQNDFESALPRSPRKSLKSCG